MATIPAPLATILDSPQIHSDLRVFASAFTGNLTIDEVAAYILNGPLCQSPHLDPLSEPASFERLKALVTVLRSLDELVSVRKTSEQAAQNLEAEGKEEDLAEFVNFSDLFCLKIAKTNFKLLISDSAKEGKLTGTEVSSEIFKCTVLKDAKASFTQEEFDDVENLLLNLTHHLVTHIHEMREKDIAEALSDFDDVSQVPKEPNVNAPANVPASSFRENLTWLAGNVQALAKDLINTYYPEPAKTHTVPDDSKDEQESDPALYSTCKEAIE